MTRPAGTGWTSLDLAMVFERWKGRQRADDTALAAHLQVSAETLAALSQEPIPAGNEDVYRLCATYGLPFDLLTDLLWETASYWRRELHQPLR